MDQDKLIACLQDIYDNLRETTPINDLDKLHDLIGTLKIQQTEKHFHSFACLECGALGRVLCENIRG